MKYTPHPNGIEMTIFKIGKIYNKSLRGKDKIELEKILRQYKDYGYESKDNQINKLTSEVEKFNKVKELLK